MLQFTQKEETDSSFTTRWIQINAYLTNFLINFVFD